MSRRPTAGVDESQPQLLVGVAIALLTRVNFSGSAGNCGACACPGSLYGTTCARWPMEWPVWGPGTGALGLLGAVWEF